MTAATTAPLSARGLGVHVAMLAILVALLSWLYLRAESVSPSEKDEYRQLLRELREIDARIDGEILANRQELNRNYDALTRHAAMAKQLAEILQKPPAYLARPDLERVGAAAVALGARIDDKLDNIDRFKREHAVLRNSLAYFPVLADELLVGKDRIADAEAQRLVSHYARDILGYVLTPDAGRRTDIREMGLQITAMRIGPALRERTAALVTHGNVLLDRSLLIDRFVGNVLAAPTAPRIEDLYRSYEAGRRHAEQAAARHHVALYALAIALLGYLGWTLLNLERARRSLLRAHDEVSARYAAQMAAEKQLKLHATAFSSAQEGILLTDASAHILDANPAFTRITGYAREDVIGRDPGLLKSGRHDREFYDAMWNCIRETGSWRGEIWNRNKLGDLYPELLSISAVRDASGTLTNYVAVFSDIGRIKAQEAQLAQIAYYDALTDLPNRVLLADRIAQAIAQTRRTQSALAVCYLDLDGFKPINDTWGHDTGDKVLIEIAHRLQNTMRGGDTVARLGGDEFVLLLLGLGSEQECDEALKRILQAIAEPFGFLPGTATVSASIGVTLFPDDGEDADTLLRHADQAMYQAKLAGKNRYHLFDAEQDRSARSRHDRISRIRQALEDGEFELHYQPKASMRSGTVVGAEALLRWKHPERGIVPPGEFLPLIEGDELIKAIGDWVIETTLFQMEEWAGNGIEIPVSVNVAGRQLQAPEFVEKLKVALHLHPRVAHLLELEVLETAALEDIAKTSSVIERCRALGVQFSLDDFGTGYSSLTYLKRLPADTIKIDQSFVRELLSDHNNLVIVQGVIGLANAFQRTVIAEGVETAEHGRLLLQLNGDLVQGYGVSRPIPGRDFAAWYRTWQPDPMWQRYGSLSWEDGDRPLIVEEIKLRAWISQIGALIQDPNAPTPQGIDDPMHTPFGEWYAGQGQERYGHWPQWATVGSAYASLHQTAQQLFNLKLKHADTPLAPLHQELLTTRDRLLSLLGELQLSVAQPRPPR